MTALNEEEEFEFRYRLEQEQGAAPKKEPGMLSQMAQGAGQALDIYGKSQFGSPQDLLGRADSMVRQGANKAGEFVAEEAGRSGTNPNVAAGMGTFMQMTPDLLETAVMPGGEIQTPNRVRSVMNKLRKPLTAPILKATKGIPPEVTRMGLDNPRILDLPGTSQSVQGRSQDIINAVKQAQGRVGAEFGAAYKQAGMNSPVDEIMSGQRANSPTFRSRSYTGPETEIPGDVVRKPVSVPGQSFTGPGREVPGDMVTHRGNVPGRSYDGISTNTPEPQRVQDPFTGLWSEVEQPMEIGRSRVNVPGQSYDFQVQGPARQVPGENVSIPGRTYTGIEQQGPQTVPGQPVSFRDVAGTRPVGQPAKDFNQLRTEYQSAMSGDLFRKGDVAGSVSEAGTTDKLAKLTELKRSLQDQAVYPQAGQQLSPSEGAHNAAIKRMASDIDSLRGTIPGGDKLAIADDAWREMTELKQRLMSSFRDPYTGQDYLNRILKGNTDWLTSGRNAGRVGAIERIEQTTGKQVLKPALEEMAAAYLRNPDAMGLSSTGLRSIISSLIPTKLAFGRFSGRSGITRGPLKMFAASRGNRLVGENERHGNNGEHMNGNKIQANQQANNNRNGDQRQNYSTSNISDQVTPKKILGARVAKIPTQEILLDFLRKARGDKDKARRMALDEGFDISKRGEN